MLSSPRIDVAMVSSILVNPLPFFFLLLTITKSGHLDRITWSVCMSKYLRILYAKFSRSDNELCIYHLLLFYAFESFSHQRKLKIFHWSLGDSNYPHVSRTLFSNLADLNNTVVWIVSTRPLISKSSSPCTNPLLTVLRAPITIGIIVTFRFYSLFVFSIPWQVLDTYLSFRFPTVLSCGQPERQSPQFGKFSYSCWSL